MGKKPTKSGKSDDETKKPITINVGNAPLVKKTLDEAAIKAVNDFGYQDDHTVANIKLALGAIACSFAAAAYLYPQPFPKNKQVLTICSVGYFFGSILLTLLGLFIEKDYILFARAKYSPALKLRSRMPRHQHLYTLTFELAPSKAGGPPTTVDVTESVGKYFDSKGLFYQEEFAQDVTKVLQQLEQQLDSKKNS